MKCESRRYHLKQPSLPWSLYSTGWVILGGSRMFTSVMWGPELKFDTAVSTPVSSNNNTSTKYDIGQSNQIYWRRLLQKHCHCMTIFHRTCSSKRRTTQWKLKCVTLPFSNSTYIYRKQNANTNRHEVNSAFFLSLLENLINWATLPMLLRFQGSKLWNLHGKAENATLVDRGSYWSEVEPWFDFISK